MSPQRAGVVLLGLLALVGTAVSGDYGVPWDEAYQRPYGRVAYEYVLEGNEALLSNNDRFHGPIVEIGLTAGERMLGLKDARTIHRFRHLFTFVLFWCALLSLAALARRMTDGEWFPILAAALLVLMPRIWADAFTNTKDLAFLSLFVIAAHTGVLLLERPSPHRALQHAVAAGALIAVRVLGVLVPGLVLLLLAAEWLRAKKKDRPRVIGAVVMLAVAAPLLTVLFWPALWENPVTSFFAAAKESSNYPWGLTVFYLGKYVPGPELPWHYVPVWIAATTPLIQLVLAALGTLAIPCCLLRRRWEHLRVELLVLAWLVLPLAMVVVLRPTLYDGWRHLYFLAPALALMGARGAEWTWKGLLCLRGRLRRMTMAVCGALLAIGLLSTTVWMALHHPHQQVYFSELAGGIRGASGRFELDYWGLSYKQLLEQLLQVDVRARIKVSVDNEPGRLNVDALPMALRQRIQLVDRREDADYHLTNHRWHYGETHGGRVTAVTVDGVEIAGAYKAKEF